MAYITGILIGRITKVNGYEGGVTVKLDKIFSENIPPMESVFLEIEGRPVPFFISELEYYGADILKLWFKGYNSIEKINEFTGCRIFLTSSTNDENQNEENQNLLGYNVFAPEDNLLGSISEIISNNGQWLLYIKSPDKKVILIPFHEHFIIRIDRRKRIVIMEIPEGLLEIN